MPHWQSVLNAEVIRIRPLSSGHNARLSIVDVADGRVLVAKEATAPNAKLDIEGRMLRYLAEHSELPVPHVWHNSADLLMMDHLPDDGRMTPKAEQQAAEALAALHQVQGKQFGLDWDTLIGPLHQPNSPSSSWVEFFAQQRLWHMAKAAHDEGKLPADLLHKLEAFLPQLPHLLSEPKFPALIHGDAWQGNVLCGANGLSGFIDPAIYYGHPEVELAFTTLFGTFSERFYHHYDAHNPIADGFWEIRKDVYNLYPLLVHVRLYGSSYLSAVESTVKKFQK